MLVRATKTIVQRNRNVSLLRRSMAKWTFNSSSMHDPTNEGKRKKWQAEDDMDIQRVTKYAIIHNLVKQQTITIENVVPWFLNAMPEAYFRQVDEATRLDHLRAIAALRDANVEMDMNLRTTLADGRRVLTFIRPCSRRGKLLSLLNDIPWDHNTTGHLPLSRVNTFVAEDDSMSLSMFTYGYQKLELIDVELCGNHLLQYADGIMSGRIENVNGLDLKFLEREKVMDYLHKCGENYISRSDPARFFKQREMYESVSGTENVATSMEKAVGIEELGNCYWVDMAVTNSLPQFSLEHAVRVLNFNNFEVVRTHVDVVKDGANGKVTHLRLVARPLDTEVEPNDEDNARMLRQLKRMKWLDPYTTTLALDRYPNLLSLRMAEVITASAALLHPIMTKQNPVIYSKGRILEYLTSKRHIAYSAEVAKLFSNRFDPDGPLTDVEFHSECTRLREEIKGNVEDSVAVELLCKMIDIIVHTLKTNLFMNDRYALSLRLDPEIMFGQDDNRERPFGVIFIHGRRFNGYHVRFRDIARGGMRLVTPPTPEQFALESARQFDECYGLSYAQQLKNKDIPEGGSKAVCLMNTATLSNDVKNIVMRKSVKAMTDSILDLIVETEETSQKIVDLYGKSEVLYLGPDEQVIPDDINWVVSRAAQRGYSIPPAFMSSKPKAGINHKVYGVTSEGVNVFLDSALRNSLKIDPKKQSFTIKLTGGPDGDVAGNELKILHREYGENAIVVGIADHSGCAEDPEGLNWVELLRLVDEELCISHFDKTKLSPSGNVYLTDSDEGVKKRNTMHNRLQSDAFVPAGGRPNTIDIHNYKQFLNDDGSPSSPLIVEGANLFITPEARQALYDSAGVMIVKDSSANKCGVICSSYEIAAAMLLSEDEFFEHKDEIVNDVLVKLRQLALMEAELLFREFENYRGSLPSMSENVSKSINKAKDSLIVALDSLSDEEKEDFMPLIRAHLPRSLADLSFERMHDRVPEQYIKNAMASALASKLVYNEGTKFVDSQPNERLAQVSLQYLRNEKEVAKLMKALDDSDILDSEKGRIRKLLETGGARTALMF